MRITLACLLLASCIGRNDDPELPPTHPPTHPTDATPPPSCPDVSTITNVGLAYANRTIADPVIAAGGTATFFVTLDGYIGTPFQLAIRSNTTIVAQPQDSTNELYVHPHAGTTDIEVYEPCSGRLLGTAFVEAAPIASVAIESYDGSPLVRSDQPQFAHLILADAAGHALQDEAAHLTSPDNISQFVAWDLIAFGNLAPGPHPFTVTSNANSYPGTLTIE